MRTLLMVGLVSSSLMISAAMANEEANSMGNANSGMQLSSQQQSANDNNANNAANTNAAGGQASQQQSGAAAQNQNNNSDSNSNSANQQDASQKAKLAPSAGKPQPKAIKPVAAKRK